MDALEVIDQPTEELDIVDQPIDEQEDDQPEPADKQSTEPAEKIDGRKFNPKWSSYLKEMKESALASGDTIRAQEVSDMLTKLRDNYARFQDVQGIAPKGIDEIKAWKTTIDAVGGPEKAAEMMQRVAAQESMDARIESGDDTFVDELPENLQKGVYGMVPQLLNRLAEKDEKAFSAAVAPHFAAALAGTGMKEHLETMYKMAGDNEPLKAEIKKQYDWLAQQTQGKGDLSSTSKTPNPEVARLQKQVSTYEQGERQKFVDNVLNTRDKAIESAFKEHVAVYVKQFGLTEAQQADLMDSFSSKVKANQVEGTPFFKQLSAYASLSKRDQAQVDTYIKSATAADAKSIIDGLVTARYGGMKTRKAPAASADTITTEGGATRVTQRPDESTWDRNKMEQLGYKATAKLGIYHLANGKTVQVVRQ